VAEKPLKAKDPVKVKTAAVEKSKLAKPVANKAKPVADKATPAKATPVKAAAAPAKAAEKGKEKTQPKQPNRIVRWWRETIGELRKVSWPTVPEARRMTGIVLVVMAATAVVLGLLDFIFSRLIGFLVAL
jgi:preprotein translocase subunit SecE